MAAEILSNSTMHMGSSPSKPVVIPQIDNLFNIRSLSVFPTRVSCPQLIQHEVSEIELEQIIQGINEALVSNPISQLGFMAGGILMSAQGVLPVQLTGGIVQILSIAISAGLSYWRMRTTIREANATHFAPRGLQFRVVTTEKMMNMVGYSTDARAELTFLENLFKKDPNKLKLALPLLRQSQGGSEEADEDGGIALSGNEIYMRRLEALADIVATVTLAESYTLNTTAAPESAADETKDFKKMFKQISSKPLRWLNDNDIKRMIKARIKWQEEIDPSKKFKKLKKIDRKEHKVASRVLWIVIMPLEKDTTRDEVIER